MTIFGASFIAGAVVIFAMASIAGDVTRLATLPVGWRLRGAAVCLLMLASIDVISARKNRYCLLGARRQTPQRLLYSHPIASVAAVWGFDTGLAVTTFRVAAITWAALALAMFGFTSWWSGLAYGVAFVAPVSIALYRKTDGAYLQRLLQRRKPLQFASAIVLLATGVALIR